MQINNRSRFGLGSVIGAAVLAAAIVGPNIKGERRPTLPAPDSPLVIESNKADKNK